MLNFTQYFAYCANFRRAFQFLYKFLVIALVLSSYAVNAQESEAERIERVLRDFKVIPIDIPRIKEAPTIDGRLQDGAWAQAFTVDIAWQNQPVGGVPAGRKTTAYIMEDGKQLYVGFKAYDPKPEEIRAFLRNRDDLFSDDYVGFGIDTNGDSTRAFEFFSNPLGVQGDAIVDLQSGEDFSFDVIFETAGQVTEQGYEVEFAIPLNQIRFPQRDGMQQWKMFFTRTYRRDRRYQSFQYPISRHNSCWLCQWQPARGLKGATPGKRFQFVPSITANTLETRDPLVSGSTERKSDIAIGIDDFRWGITPDMSINATINPDFSQLEADVAQVEVNNTFSLFYPETRPFFLEGRDLFSTRINLVNTRNIADPDYGLKLSGKVNSNVYGILTARDDITNVLIPGFESSSIETLDRNSQDSTLRYRRDFENASYVGALITDRRSDNYSNEVVSLDGQYRFTKKDTLQLQWIKTDTENPPEFVNDTTLNLSKTAADDAYYINYFHNGTNSFYRITQRSFGPDFRADSGFISRVDYVDTSGEVNYNWRGEPGSFATHANTGYFTNHTTIESTGAFNERTRGAFANVTIPRETFFEFNRVYTEKQYDGQRFFLRMNHLNFSSNPFNGLNYSARLSIGDQIDYANTRKGRQRRFFQFIDFNATRHLLMSLRQTYQRLYVDQRELFTAHLVDLRFTYQFDVRSYLRLTLIYDDLDRNPDLYTDAVDSGRTDIDAQLLYSYKINPQSVFFAGLSSSGVNNDDLDQLEKTGFSLFVKWTYAWRL